MLCRVCGIDMAVRRVSADGVPIESCINPKCPRCQKQQAKWGRYAGRRERGGERMKKTTGAIGHTGSQVVEAATPKKGGKKPDVKKGGDLRSR